MAQWVRGFTLGRRTCSGTTERRAGCGTLDALSATELLTLKWSILCYVNFTSTKYFVINLRGSFGGTLRKENCTAQNGGT